MMGFRCHYCEAATPIPLITIALIYKKNILVSYSGHYFHKYLHYKHDDTSVNQSDLSSLFFFVSASFSVSLHPLSDVWPACILHAFAKGIYRLQLVTYNLCWSQNIHSLPFFVHLHTWHLAAVFVPAFS